MITPPRIVLIAALPLLASAGIPAAAESPGKLRSEMARAERDFIALYNKANTNPDFAIVCRMDTPTGSSFAVRVCQPKYLLAANARSASERMQAAVAAGNATGAANANGPNVGAGSGAAPGDSAVADKDAAFKQNMLDLLQKNAELQALGRKRDELQAQLDEATRGKAKP